MNSKKNSSILIIISVIVILFTEIIGVNIQIAFNYLPIFFGIITIILFNLKINGITDTKNLIILNIIILGINLVLTSFITGNLSYSSILAVLIFCKFTDKINDLQFDKLFIKNIIIYYIIPLVILLGGDVGYTKIISEITVLNNVWMVNYSYFALFVIYKLLIANIVMVMLMVVFKEIIDLKISININHKIIMFIFSSIIFIILCIKITLGFTSMNNANDKIVKLREAIQNNKLNTYYELNFDTNIKADDISEVQDEEQKYMLSFNQILIKGVASWSEISYKIETNGIQNMVNRKTMTQKEALQRYKNSAENYINRLNIYNEDLSMQNIANIIIYVIDVICIFVIYKKIEK
ncbi:MAG: hypothetical protein IKF38_01570 [Clostridia bacterium]|nr:hypothetical protein [Clostridia bacterium]